MVSADPGEVRGAAVKPVFGIASNPEAAEFIEGFLASEDPLGPRYASLEDWVADCRDGGMSRAIKPLELIDGKPRMRREYHDAPLGVAIRFMREGYGEVKQRVCEQCNEAIRSDDSGATAFRIHSESFLVEHLVCGKCVGKA